MSVVAWRTSVQAKHQRPNEWDKMMTHGLLTPCVDVWVSPRTGGWGVTIKG